MTTPNLLIHGDNLIVLKELEKDYTGKVKCVYIDPPYNTRKKLIHYNDKFGHSEWLNMMRPRLEILRRLLRDDGSIWISIDDDECHYLKVLCDEIFGRKNFIANVIWQKKCAAQNDARYLSDTHDHILVYAKDASSANARKWLLPRTEEMDARYKNPDDDPRGPWMSGDLSVKSYSAACDYPIKTPSGRVVQPPAGGCWRVSKIRFRELIADNRILFGKDGSNVPSIKRFLSEVQQGTVAKTIWLRDEVGDNKKANREVKVFNSNEVFQTPKPERLLQRILHLATDPGDIVLDCFAGSGTTGAVAHKMGRRWIMVELGDHCHTHIVPRLQQVIDGTDQGGISKDVEWTGGGGYRYIHNDGNTI
jgi:adenine-specific DNA-methyltransferase